MDRRRVSIVVAGVVLFIAALSPIAGAHPLGNFTTNRFAALEVGPDTIAVSYVVDFAEVAALQEIPVLNDAKAAVDAALDAYAIEHGSRLLSGLRLTVDGEPVPLEVTATRALRQPGEGPLHTLRLEVTYSASLPEDPKRLEYTDSNYVSRLGWKEVIANGVNGREIASSTVPTESISAELTSYPRALLQDPLQTARAAIELGKPDGSTEEEVDDEVARGIDDPGTETESTFGGSFPELIEGDLSFSFVLSALALSVGFGALHALGPGHGKSIMAAYLVGAGGRMRHAVSIGVAVSAMHTLSVLALGGITLWAASLFRPEDVYPWLSLISGLAIAAIGAWLFVRRMRAGRHDHDLVHSHHDHDQSRELPGGTSPLSWRGLGVVALSGGILPSPTALIVLLGAVALHRVVLGIALVAGFSIGLAGALTLIGVAVLRARDFAGRKLGSARTARLQIASAAGVVVLGAILTVRALMQF